MSGFSERYGYIKPSETIVRERITPEIQNAICSCFDRLEESIGFHDYLSLQKYLWTEFLNQRERTFQSSSDVIGNFMQDDQQLWYKKLDMIEAAIVFLTIHLNSFVKGFVEDLNREFVRLHFAYQVTEGKIAELSTSNELQVINDSMNMASEEVMKQVELNIGSGRKGQADRKVIHNLKLLKKFALKCCISVEKKLSL
ncbi:hypothetical protein NG821_09300 [Prevotella cerevisiae]|uniref:HEPN AbiJ-N-terminal domain-containing protein n=1 Tax=Segatella cerevisiae TaxID=2053716 RepID=A0ABT1BY72_9BACT|nr:hypothetical protein [Segatella cerevisiae]MCO6026031.1 hypothetical protein [Segatella cerevisiae]